MAIEYNEKQKEAIFEHLNENVLVSAAAGSGKTAVLVDRVFNLVTRDTDNISLSDMLIMTFTNKATLEMKGRLKEKLETKLKEMPDNKNLIKESALIQNANISTIDSFCKKILEENYNDISEKNSHFTGFDPASRIADEKELRVLYDEVLDDVLEEKYGDETYKALFDAYIDKNDDEKLKDMLLNALFFLSSLTWPDEYIEDRIRNFEKESKEQYKECIDLYINDLKNQKENIQILTDFLALMEKTKGTLELDGKTKLAAYSNVIDMITYVKELIKVYKDMTEISFDKDSVGKYLKNVHIGKIGTFPRKDKVDCDGNVYEEYKDCIKELSNIIDRINKLNELYNLPKKIICNDNEKTFYKLLLEFYLRVENEKKNRNILAISDYAALSLDILYDKVIENGQIKRVISKKAKDISNKYKMIFVDEYQDTNIIQEKILSAISNEYHNKNVFMVGDIKQSIYGFRNAEPKIFADKYEKYDKNHDEGKLITLDTNYRSGKEILMYVNDLFSKVMTIEKAGIDYKKDGLLGIPKDAMDRESTSDSKVELVSVNFTKDDGDETSNKSYEAQYVAKRIKELKESGKYDYKDIVILFRKTKDVSDYYVDALTRFGIPVYCEQKKGFYDRLEIKLIIDILSIIDNPLQDIPLASVLVSNIYNLNNDELSFLKIVYLNNINKDEDNDEILDGRVLLYDAIMYAYTNIEDFEDVCNQYDIDYKNFKNKIVRFIDDLSILTFNSRYKSISELINTIYDMYDIKAMFMSMNDGKMRVGNLDILYKNALSYEGSSYVGLFNFLKYVKKIIERNDDQGQAKIIDENDNVVNIMTLHSAKGLQFKVVFLCYTTGKYNKEDLKSTIYFSKEYGLALSYIDEKDRYKYVTPKRTLIEYEKTKKLCEEEMRMLYVALTRAKEKLIITSYIKKKDSEPYDILDTVSKEDSYWNLIASNYSGDTEYCEYKMETIAADDMKYIDENIYDLDASNISKVDIEKIDNMSVSDTVKQFEKDNLEKNEINNYYFETLKLIKPKFSVSAIKKEKRENNNNFNSIEKLPSLIVSDYFDDEALQLDINDNNKRVDGTTLGTAYHRYMQFFNYEKNKYVNNGDKVSGDDLENMIDKIKIDKFLNSNIGKRCKIASENNLLYREQPFMKLFSRDEVNTYMYNDKNGDGLKIPDDIAADKQIVIQGIIDAFIIEKDENGEESIILIDYKTDKLLYSNKIVKEKLRKELIDNYSIQLKIYADALSELTGMKVKEKYIYSFALDEEIEIG